MPSPLKRVERARPLLGTTVAIRVHGLDEAPAHRAIDAAFAEIATIHQVMSFQEQASDISRLNREAAERAVEVHPATFEVLCEARAMSQSSKGVFDITVAARLVEWGILPRPTSLYDADAAAGWRDVEMIEPLKVRFLRPLWIDVSGIAKGYAVDRAIAILRGHGAVQASVNAGGDLRIFGPDSERIALAPEKTEALPFLEIENGAVASSSGHLERRLHAGQMRGPHVDARDGKAVPVERFVSIVAETCLIADALTKPVLILREESSDLLTRYNATAHLHEPGLGWRHLPVAA